MKDIGIIIVGYLKSAGRTWDFGHPLHFLIITYLQWENDLFFFRFVGFISCRACSINKDLNYPDSKKGNEVQCFCCFQDYSKAASQLDKYIIKIQSSKISITIIIIIILIIIGNSPQLSGFSCNAWRTWKMGGHVRNHIEIFMYMEKKDSLRGYSPVPAARSVLALATTWIACFIACSFTWTDQWRISQKREKVIF